MPLLGHYRGFNPTGAFNIINNGGIDSGILATHRLQWDCTVCNHIAVDYWTHGCVFRHISGLWICAATHTDAGIENVGGCGRQWQEGFINSLQ